LQGDHQVDREQEVLVELDVRVGLPGVDLDRAAEGDAAVWASPSASWSRARPRSATPVAMLPGASRSRVARARRWLLRAST
jgi:hypothetical protein